MTKSVPLSSMATLSSPPEDRKYPHVLVSPIIHKSPQWTWAIISIGIGLFGPRWARPHSDYHGFATRTVVYLDINGRVQGQGRVWLPFFSTYGLRLLFALRGFFSPRRLVGSEAIRMFGHAVRINVISSELSNDLLTPFAFGQERMMLTRKLLMTDAGKLIAIVEEKFLTNFLDSLQLQTGA